MNKLKTFLVKVNLIKISPESVTKWAKHKDLEMLEYTLKNGDFWARKEVAKELVDFDESISIPLLSKLLHDKVFIVAENAIESLHTFNLAQEQVIEINSVLAHWEERARIKKENWTKPAHSDGLVFDKSQMKRLSQLKNLLSKQKGSMSIG